MGQKLVVHSVICGGKTLSMGEKEQHNSDVLMMTCVRRMRSDEAGRGDTQSGRER